MKNLIFLALISLSINAFSADRIREGTSSFRHVSCSGSSGGWADWRGLSHIDYFARGPHFYSDVVAFFVCPKNQTGYVLAYEEGVEFPFQSHEQCINSKSLVEKTFSTGKCVGLDFDLDSMSVNVQTLSD